MQSPDNVHFRAMKPSEMPKSPLDTSQKTSFSAQKEAPLLSKRIPLGRGKGTFDALKGYLWGQDRYFED